MAVRIPPKTEDGETRWEVSALCARDPACHGWRHVQRKFQQACRPAARRRGDGEMPMNATATITPAGPQHMRALERANQVRLARAELKRRVADGEIDVAAVILDCPWEARS